nr:hypothetical protein [Paracoccus mutanolyticus]
MPGNSLDHIHHEPVWLTGRWIDEGKRQAVGLGPDLQPVLGLHGDCTPSGSQGRGHHKGPAKHDIPLNWATNFAPPRHSPRRLLEPPCLTKNRKGRPTAFTAWLMVKTGARQRQQAALPPDAEIRMILRHRFL